MRSKDGVDTEETMAKDEGETDSSGGIKSACVCSCVCVVCLCVCVLVCLCVCACVCLSTDLHPRFVDEVVTQHLGQVGRGLQEVQEAVPPL